MLEHNQDSLPEGVEMILHSCLTACKLMGEIAHEKDGIDWGRKIQTPQSIRKMQADGFTTSVEQSVQIFYVVLMMR